MRSGMCWGVGNLQSKVCSKDLDCSVGEKCCSGHCAPLCETTRPCERYTGILPCANDPKVVYDQRGCAVGCEQDCCISGKSIELEGSGTRCLCVGGSWKCKVKQRNDGCTPGDLLKSMEEDGDGRKSCVCGSNGQWKCRYPQSGVVSKECKPGQTRPDGACNTCTCSRRGVWKCTSRPCVRACQSGETKKMGCRRCTCGSSGQWECEKRRCGPPPGACLGGARFHQDHAEWLCVEGVWRREASSREPEAECSAGQVKTAGCLPCVCTNGKWDCPETSACPPLAACVDGDRKKILCNDCVCENGAWACSKKNCPAPTICVEGAKRPTGDSCNEDTCINNSWVSSQMTCSGTCLSGDLKQLGCHSCMCVNSRWLCSSGPCNACFDYACPVGTRVRYAPERLCPAEGQPCRPCMCVDV